MLSYLVISLCFIHGVLLQHISKNWHGCYNLSSNEPFNLLSRKDFQIQNVTENCTTPFAPTDVGVNVSTVVNVRGYIHNLSVDPGDAIYHTAYNVTFLPSDFREALLIYTPYSEHYKKECFRITSRGRRAHIYFDCYIPLTHLQLFGLDPMILEVYYSSGIRETKNRVYNHFLMSIFKPPGDGSIISCKASPFIITNLSDLKRPLVTIQTECKSHYQVYNITCGDQVIVENVCVHPHQTEYHFSPNQTCEKFQVTGTNYDVTLHTNPKCAEYQVLFRTEHELADKNLLTVALIVCGCFVIIILVIVIYKKMKLNSLFKKESQNNKIPKIKFHYCKCQQHETFWKPVEGFIAFLQKHRKIEISSQDGSPVGFEERQILIPTSSNQTWDFNCIIPLPKFENHIGHQNTIDIDSVNMRKDSTIILKFPFFQPKDVISNLPFDGKKIPSFQLMNDFTKFIRYIHNHNPNCIQKLSIPDAWLDELQQKLIEEKYTNENFEIICDERYRHVLEHGTTVQFSQSKPIEEISIDFT